MRCKSSRRYWSSWFCFSRRISPTPLTLSYWKFPFPHFLMLSVHIEGKSAPQCRKSEVVTYHEPHQQNPDRRKSSCLNSRGEKVESEWKRELSSSKLKYSSFSSWVLVLEKGSSPSLDSLCVFAQLCVSDNSSAGQLFSWSPTEQPDLQQADSRRLNLKIGLTSSWSSYLSRVPITNTILSLSKQQFVLFSTVYMMEGNCDFFIDSSN
jgi:hypothetical protein